MLGNNTSAFAAFRFFLSAGVRAGGGYGLWHSLDSESVALPTTPHET
jgi:hypothetical protein